MFPGGEESPLGSWLLVGRVLNETFPGLRKDSMHGLAAQPKKLLFASTCYVPCTVYL